MDKLVSGTLVTQCFVIIAMSAILLVQNAQEEPDEEIMIPDYTTKLTTIDNSIIAIRDDMDEMKKDVAQLERGQSTLDSSALETKLNSAISALNTLSSQQKLDSQKISSIDTKLTELERDSNTGRDVLTARVANSSIDAGDDLEVSGTCGPRERVQVELQHITVRTGEYFFDDATTADADGDWDISLDTDNDMPTGRYNLFVECDGDDQRFGITVD